ncbi:hypothetical protein CHLNCDRAFT_133327 [Chlorella variabilis]|uniref:MTTase N-terminal domain-containing protein n=1 Tax=Chlorella variabilis TaxID=554065 RepID=E1Z2V6_CHLVA|nr:hypothetical protein CHLNCDRAFT_133327 [Chlorella variabilis]EFN60061.1 hypothetical protein CHLNCDRAFT_133327 [Chlorella variabilis]|eukprot:XP_005852163.1 hypothetical protein CHLNCDRAFT_133327 [Chlorella variabilis]
MHVTAASSSRPAAPPGGPAPRRRAPTVRAAATPSAPEAQEKKGLRVSMVSLGCPKNTVDGEASLQADAIVINTCGFVEDAKDESIEVQRRHAWWRQQQARLIGRIRRTIIEAARMKEDGRVRRVVVTGCLAQRYSQELAEQLPEADLVVGFEKYGSLSASLRTILDAPPDIDMDEYRQRSRVQVGEATVAFRPEWDRHRLTPRHTAYLRLPGQAKQVRLTWECCAKE